MPCVKISYDEKILSNIITIQLVNIYIMIIDYYIKLFTHTHTHTHTQIHTYIHTYIYMVCVYIIWDIYILHDYVVAKYSHMYVFN